MSFSVSHLRFTLKNVCTKIFIKDFISVSQRLKSSLGSYFYKSLFLFFIVQKLRVLAKRLAENLNLNYFDVKANSKDRILFHHTMRFENRPHVQSREGRRDMSHVGHCVRSFLILY